MMNDGDPFFESALLREQYAKRSLLYLKLLTSSTTSTTVPTFDNKKYILRSLTHREIETLTGNVCRCRCTDWTTIRLLYAQDGSANHDLSPFLAEQFSESSFSGFVVLGVALNKNEFQTDSSAGEQPAHIRVLRPGVHRNTCIHDCILEPGCRVYGNGILEKTHIYPNASVINCGTITRSVGKDGAPSMGLASQLEICVGPEAGGERMIEIFPESNIVDTCQSLIRPSNKPKTTKLAQFQKSDLLFKLCLLNILLPYSSIHDNPNTINDVFLSNFASIHSSSTVSYATLLAHSTIRSNSNVSNTCLQWNASVSKSAIVHNSIIMEASSASNSAIVNCSIIGPDTHLEGGETGHSLLGPSVNSHHQSLLLGVIWPCGRGNVGYGANVGSNHTGRIPDQECWAGEGLFWGLSAVVKFPLDMTFSPYSIVAAGTTVHPQKIEMPFSLIVDDKLHPGWVLGYSPYTITRNERKYIQRRKATRHKPYTGWNIMRPGIAQMCFNARAMLMSKKVRGIGKYHLTEKSKADGIRIYSQFIQRYVLQGLLRQVLKISESKSKMHDSLLSLLPPEIVLDEKNIQNDIIFPWDEPSFSNLEEEWKYQLALIRHEFKDANLAFLLKHLSKLESEYAESLAYSKSKDDYRGNKVIPGYKDCHVSAEDDSVVKMVREEAAATKATIEKILMGENVCLGQTRSRI